ncbi:MAG: WD40 repeat domain-containing protein [Coleofasciculaceae cyanobacterium SM2_1_6]|nr:WD40 repeat domain-containing protein [Coleofasciculaceae cyanobacterium SM2_1_6]
MSSDSSSITSFAFSPDSKTIATASADKTVKLWNLEGQVLQTLTGHSSDVISSSFLSPRPFSPSSEALKLPDFGTTNTSEVFKSSSSLSLFLAKSLAFSPDGKTIVLGDLYGMNLWNLDLNDLTARACNWLHDYLTTNSNAKPEDKKMCNIPLSKKSGILWGLWFW